MGDAFDRLGVELQRAHQMQPAQPHVLHRPYDTRQVHHLPGLVERHDDLLKPLRLSNRGDTE